MIDVKLIGMGVLWPTEHRSFDQHVDIAQFTNTIALVHTYLNCATPCAIHDPSDHHMRNLPVFYRSDRNIVERCCSDGVWHPDPDQVTRWQETLSHAEAVAQSTHGCCKNRCCEAPPTEGDSK